MPTLSVPVSGARGSFLAAMDEFRAESNDELDDDTRLAPNITDWGGRWSTPDGFAAYVAAVSAEGDEKTPRPEGWVPETTWWWVDGDEYLGRISLRHRLTPRRREVGGHIGYDARPSAQRRGHATAMLATVLPLADAMGIHPVLVTCDVGNVASRRVIEANGGRLEDERHGKLRYWLPCGCKASGSPVRASGMA